MKLKSVSPGKLNRPAWMRARVAELGPDFKAGEGVASLVTSQCSHRLHNSPVSPSLPRPTYACWTTMPAAAAAMRSETIANP